MSKFKILTSSKKQAGKFPSFMSLEILYFFFHRENDSSPPTPLARLSP